MSTESGLPGGRGGVTLTGVSLTSLPKGKGLWERP